MVIKKVIYNMHSISICILFNPKLIWSFSLVILWSVISRYRYLWFHKIPHLDWWPLSFISEVLWLCDLGFYERIPYVWSVLVYIFTRVYWVMMSCLAERCLHVLWVVQLLPKSQTLREVSWWQSDPWWHSVCQHTELWLWAIQNKIHQLQWLQAYSTMWSYC